MNNSKSPTEKPEQPILSLIQDIKDKKIDPKTLDKELRQQCVEVFLGEGYSISNMAQILNRNEKTIRRDIADIRERNALSPDVNLAKKIVGEAVFYARLHRDHLMRLARMKEASVSERSQAEYYAWVGWINTLSKLQSLGYLPNLPQTIEGNITHHHNHQGASFEDMHQMIIEVEKTAQETGSFTAEMSEEIHTLRDQLTKAQLEEKVRQISIKKEADNSKEVDHGQDDVKPIE